LAEQKLSLALTDAALNHIVAAGYDPVYGARPLKRAIQRELENPIATKILENTFVEEDTILIDCVENQLIFAKQALPPEPETEDPQEAIAGEEEATLVEVGES
jgi:ATP-dependent Clp protease ATP-binding subunit ClpB